MCEKLPPVTEHEWWDDFIDYVGMRKAIKLWNKGQTEQYRYCRDPDAKTKGIQNDAAKNPLRLLRETFENLIASGLEGLELAKQGLSLLTAVFPQQRKPSDKDMLEAELLDTYPHIVALHTAIRAKKPLSLVKKLAEMAKDDLDQDIDAYEREIEKGA